MDMTTLEVVKFKSSVLEVTSPPFAALSIIKSVGSSVHIPVSPVGAVVLTVAEAAIFSTRPEVSTFPPLPPMLPACADISPVTFV